MNRELPKIYVHEMPGIDIEIDGKSEDESRAKKVLAGYGLPAADFINVWKSNSSSLDSALKHNLPAIASLEKQHQGICLALSTEFGVYHFARYPQQLLVQQYLQRNQQDMPHGIILAARADNNSTKEKWNNSFYDKDWMNVLRKLHSQLGVNFAIRVAESGSVKDFQNKFAMLKKKYVRNKKMSFGLIAGHGNIDHIALGAKKAKDYYLHHSDFSQKWFKDIGESFYPNATIILDVCHTGEEEAIGTDISDAWNLRVIAPMGQGSIQDIETFPGRSRIGFSAKYSFGTPSNDIQPL